MAFNSGFIVDVNVLFGNISFISSNESGPFGIIDKSEDNNDKSP